MDPLLLVLQGVSPAWVQLTLLRQQTTLQLLAPATTTPTTDLPSEPLLHLTSSFPLERFIPLFLPPRPCFALHKGFHGEPALSDVAAIVLQGTELPHSHCSEGRASPVLHTRERPWGILWLSCNLHLRDVAFYLGLWQLLDLD